MPARMRNANLGRGICERRQNPTHTKQVECSGCYARIWVHPNNVSGGYCMGCRNALFTPSKGYSYDNAGWDDDDEWWASHGSRGYYTKPSECKPARPAFEFRAEHLAKLRAS